MPESHTFAGPALYGMLALCFLSIGFMLRVLSAFIAESRIEPARHLISVAPAPGRTGQSSEQVFDDVPMAFAVRYSTQFDWRRATGDSTQGRTV